MSANDIADLQATVAEAHWEYAHANGDGLNAPDWLGASEYQCEGMTIGDNAMYIPEAEREDYIEAQCDQFPAPARYLISWAAKLRIAENEREASKDPAKPSFFPVACDVVGAK